MRIIHENSVAGVEVDACLCYNAHKYTIWRDLLMLELLAPAGSMEALRAAVQNGANAVYLGCGTFNARQSAKNFTPQTLVEAVKYCHVRGVAVHLTLNTLVSDRETPALIELIRHAAASGVDAFIVQDLGVIELCREIAPSVALHGSTQMTIHSLSGVLLCASLGMSRVVLSRELSREEIQYICRNSPIEIEVFAHGALCMCYSGQCYLSAAIGGRSGNRGRCAQPCRQSYGYGRWENRYPLSLKDNCLVHEVQHLEDMGVTSIKLEGRMKRPEYVASVTGVYRKAIDEGKVTRGMMDELYTAFNRQGFTDGYYMARTGPDMFGVREETKEDPAWVKAARQTYETGEHGLVPIYFAVSVTSEGSRLAASDPDGRLCRVTGPVPEAARNLPLTGQMLADRIGKTGGTPYRCMEVKVQLEPGLTMPAAAINAMRRDVLNQLTALRARRDPVTLNRPRRVTKFSGRRGAPELTVQVVSRDQITGKLLKMHPSVLYVPIHILTEDPAWTQELLRRAEVCAVLPRIVHDGEMEKLKNSMLALRKAGVGQVLIGNLGLLLPAREGGMAVRGEFGLNLYNSGAVNKMREMELVSATLSFEMTMPQIRDVSKAVPCELLIYGRLPLMVTENCLIRGRTGECTCHLAPVKLVDKTGAEFPVIKDGNTCRSVLLNGKKLYWLDRQDELARLGIWAGRLSFTTENSREVDQILSDFQRSAEFDPGACTRGLYLRGID